MTVQDIYFGKSFLHKDSFQVTYSSMDCNQSTFNKVLRQALFMKYNLRFGLIWTRFQLSLEKIKQSNCTCHTALGLYITTILSLRNTLEFFRFWSLMLIKQFYHTLAEYSWSIANNIVIDVYCRCLEILYQIAFSRIANYFRSYRKKQFGIESVGIYSRHQ